MATIAERLTSRALTNSGRRLWFWQREIQGNLQPLVRWVYWPWLILQFALIASVVPNQWQPFAVVLATILAIGVLLWGIRSWQPVYTHSWGVAEARWRHDQWKKKAKRSVGYALFSCVWFFAFPSVTFGVNTVLPTPTVLMFHHGTWNSGRVYRLNHLPKSVGHLVNVGVGWQYVVPYPVYMGTRDHDVYTVKGNTVQRYGYGGACGGG